MWDKVLESYYSPQTHLFSIILPLSHRIWTKVAVLLTCRVNDRNMLPKTRLEHTSNFSLRERVGWNAGSGSSKVAAMLGLQTRCISTGTNVNPLPYVTQTRCTNVKQRRDGLNTNIWGICVWGYTHWDDNMCLACVRPWCDHKDSTPNTTQPNVSVYVFKKA